MKRATHPNILFNPPPPLFSELSGSQESGNQDNTSISVSEYTRLGRPAFIQYTTTVVVVVLVPTAPYCPFCYPVEWAYIIPQYYQTWRRRQDSNLREKLQWRLIELLTMEAEHTSFHVSTLLTEGSSKQVVGGVFSTIFCASGGGPPPTTTTTTTITGDHS